MNNEKITLEQIELLKSKTKITAEHLKPYIKTPKLTDEVKNKIREIHSDSIKNTNDSEGASVYFSAHLDSYIRREIHLLNQEFAYEDYCKDAYKQLFIQIRNKLFTEWMAMSSELCK